MSILLTNSPMVIHLILVQSGASVIKTVFGMSLFVVSTLMVSCVVNCYTLMNSILKETGL